MAAALGELVAVLQHHMVQFQRQMEELDQGSLYFGGSLTPQGLLDFMIWKHEADRLGIQLTAGDVRDEVIREAFGKLNQRGDKSHDVSYWNLNESAGGCSLEMRSSLPNLLLWRLFLADANRYAAANQTEPHGKSCKEAVPPGRRSVR